MENNNTQNKPSNNKKDPIFHFIQPSPGSSTGSESGDQCPTIFVEAFDKASFAQVVQMLTGQDTPELRLRAGNLYQRRNSLISPLVNPVNNSQFQQQQKTHILFPEFPSPVTPLVPDPFDPSGWSYDGATKHAGGKRAADADPDDAGEMKRLKGKDAYVPAALPPPARKEPPKLLNLFPVTPSYARVSDYFVYGAGAITIRK